MNDSLVLKVKPEQGYRLTYALQEFVQRLDRQLHVGDQFVVNMDGVETRVTERGRFIRTLFCAANFTVLQRILASPNKRRLPDEDKVYMPITMCWPGVWHLTNVLVTVTGRGLMIERADNFGAFLDQTEN